MNAAMVLVNNKNSLSSVKFTAVTDALLSGGVFLDETAILPYDAPQRVTSTLARLISDHAFVYLICDEPLLASAREAVSAATGESFEEGYYLPTQSGFCFVLPAGKKGAEIIRSETIPLVDEKRGNSYSRVCIRTVCAPSELLSETVKKAEAAADGKLSLHVSVTFGNGRIEVIYDRNTPKMLADEVIRILATDLADYIYSMEDEGIEKRLVDALTNVFYEGLNTYDNASKEERLGVSNFTLKQKGAVSDQTAYEMAAGLIRHGKCDIAIATTGYAGPSTENRPAGLCYIAIGTKENVRVYRQTLVGSREEITKTAIQLALFLAFREIK